MKMKNAQKKIALSLCMVLVVTLLSSCGLFGGSKQENKDDNKQSETIGTTETTEHIDSTEVDSTETTSTEVPSTTETLSTENVSTEVPETEATQESEPESKPQQETQDKKPSNTQQNNNQQNTTSKPEDIDPGEKMAKDIVSKIIKSGMSDFEKAITIHDWLTFNIDYDLTYTHYYLEETLRDRTGVCQGYALAFNSMAKHAGLNCVYITGKADNGSGSGYQGHAWNRVKINGAWYNVDVTWDDPVYDGKKPSDHSMNGYDYFLVSDSTLNKDHKVEMIAGEAGNANKDYDKTAILKFAINSGKYGDVELVTSIDEGAKVIDKRFKTGTKELHLWYYNNKIKVDMLNTHIEEMISEATTPFVLFRSYTADDSVLAKITLVYQYSYDEWNSFPLVTNATEFENLYNTMKAQGIKEYKIRYETTDGNLSYGEVSDLIISKIEYKNTNYLMDIYIP